MKGKVGEVPTVRDWTIMETRQRENSMAIQIKTRGRVRANTPHGVTISHMVGCSPSVHDAMNSAEDEVWTSGSTAARDPSDLGIQEVRNSFYPKLGSSHAGSHVSTLTGGAWLANTDAVNALAGGRGMRGTRTGSPE